MPTLLTWRGHKFRFYASDGPEPPHVHVIKGEKAAKVWLRDLSVAYNRGYSEQELSRLLAVVSDHRNDWIGSWNDFFGV